MDKWQISWLYILFSALLTYQSAKFFTKNMQFYHTEIFCALKNIGFGTMNLFGNASSLDNQFQWKAAKLRQKFNFMIFIYQFRNSLLAIQFVGETNPRLMYFFLSIPFCSTLDGNFLMKLNNYLLWPQWEKFQIILMGF